MHRFVEFLVVETTVKNKSSLITLTLSAIGQKVRRGAGRRGGGAVDEWARGGSVPGVRRGGASQCVLSFCPRLCVS